MQKYGVLSLVCALFSLLTACSQPEELKPGFNDEYAKNAARLQTVSIPLKFLGSWNNLGVPNYLAKPDLLDPAFIARIDAALPEGKSVKELNPQFLAEGKKRNIVMKEDGELWITLVNEHAGWLNTLGFYTYPKNKHPRHITDTREITVIFPNVSLVGNGGGLKKGDKVKLGFFKKGTVIGFVLMARGWTTTPKLQGAYKLFTNHKLNEVHPNLKVHSVGLFDRLTGKVVVSFEDIRRDLPSCDNDFNDNTFYITPSPTHCVDVADMAPIGK